MSAFIWAVCSFIFCCGLSAVVFRRELLAMLLGLELMISAVNVSLVYHAGAFSDADALAAVLLIIAVAAAEAVVGLSLILKLSRGGREATAPALRELRG